MKLKKVLAAALAGTMVMASAATVFASNTVADTAWWSDVMQTSDNTQLVGDGTWTYVVATAAYSGTLDGEDFTVPPNFNVEIVDTETTTTYYITSNTLGSIWQAGDCTYENMTGDTGGSATWSTQTGDIWTVTVTREGQDFTFVYDLNGSTVIKQTMTGTNMPEDVSCHILSATGVATYAVTTDGSVPTIDAYTEDWYGAFDDDGVAVLGQVEGTDTESADTEAADTKEESAAADDDADAADDADADDDASSTTSDSSDAEDDSEGGVSAVVIVVIVVIVVVVVVVIIAVVMATRKKK